jgi:RNA-directed DNA polymerase
VGHSAFVKMPKLASLKSISTRRELAKLLKFKPSALAYLLFRRPAATKYKVFEIPKRKGGTRTISAPTDALKLVQKRLSDLLQDCVLEINATKNRKDKIAHGFKRKRSIVTNVIWRAGSDKTINLQLTASRRILSCRNPRRRLLRG